jgi:hypothetical protein
MEMLRRTVQRRRGGSLRFYPVELAVEMHRAIPHSSLWIAPDGLHVPVFLAERETFARTAMSFLGV